MYTRSSSVVVHLLDGSHTFVFTSMIVVVVVCLLLLIDDGCCLLIMIDDGRWSMVDGCCGRHPFLQVAGD